MIPTREELERLRELAGKATPGPWKAHTREDIRRCGDLKSYIAEQWHGYAWVGRVVNGRHDSVLANLDRRNDGCKEYRDAAGHDAAYIAAAHPAMIAHLLACEAALRELVAGLDDSRDRSVIGGTCALMHAESAARALMGEQG